MSRSFLFSFSRKKAETAVKKALSGTKTVLDAVKEINNGLGLKYSGLHDGFPFSFVMYFNKKGFSTRIVLEKSGESFSALISELTGSSLSAGPETKDDDNLSLLKTLIGKSRIGTDESGKGDFFGPLVIAGVYVNAETEVRLEAAGVKDSKLLKDINIFSSAEQIRQILDKDDYELVVIAPEKYNRMYASIKNLNKLLAWGHARVLENILSRHSCDCALADRFGDEKRIKQALMEKGSKLCLHQVHRAERDTAVAAASILARDRFVREMESLSQQFKIELPKGASSRVEAAGRSFVKTYGPETLKKVAKLHFKTVSRITA